MIKHLIKLVWNRKRINFLITVEIFISFLVLFAVVLLGIYYVDNYNKPLGFKYENVWTIAVDMKVVGDDEFTPEQVQNMRQLMIALKEFNEIESVAGSMSTPYSNSSYRSGMDHGKQVIFFEFNEVTDDFNKVMGVDLIAGRWFSKEDDGSESRPIIINQRMSREVYGNENPIGKEFGEPSGKEKKRTKVIGVISDFRKGGEFAAPENEAFYRKNIDSDKDRPPQSLLIKVRPGTTAAFEEKLVARMQNVAKGWSFEVEPMSEIRETTLKSYLAPFLAVGIVAGFLMIMVALGLTGVLWQNVTQRTREIGLRRAKGATATNIYRQIIGELMIIASFGMLIGIVLIIQVPLLDLLGVVSNRAYLISLIISIAMIYLLTIVCSFYPSFLATKVNPAQALHYE